MTYIGDPTNRQTRKLYIYKKDLFTDNLIFSDAVESMNMLEK
jgi:hypothetical protein